MDLNNIDHIDDKDKVPDESKLDEKKEELNDKQTLKEIQTEPIEAKLNNFFDFKPGNVQHMVLSGPTKSGKTELCINIVENYLPCFECVVIMCGTYPFSHNYDDLVKRHPKKIKIYTYSNQLLQNFINVSKQRSLSNKMIYTLLVIDDYTNLIDFKTKIMISKFLTLARHQRINVFLLSHQVNDTVTRLMKDSIQYFIFRMNSINSLKLIHDGVFTADNKLDFLQFTETIKEQDRDYWFICLRKCGDQLDGLYKIKGDRRESSVDREKKEKKEEIKKHIENKEYAENKIMDIQNDLKNNDIKNQPEKSIVKKPIEQTKPPEDNLFTRLTKKTSWPLSSIF